MIWSAPWESLFFCLVLLAAPVVAAAWQSARWTLGVLAVAITAALFAPYGPLAYLAVAVTVVLHGLDAWRSTRTGAVTLFAVALLSVGVAVALHFGQLTAAFVLSTLAVAIRSGVWPLHVGVASLCERAPVVQTQQLASLVALVFVHLRFVDHHPEALALAPMVARLGAFTAFLGALLATVQSDLRGFYRATTSMHGGLILAAIGVASRDNFAAALLVTVAGSLALGGLGIMITSLEQRVGPVRFTKLGGLARSFPRLTAAFALFGVAGVAMPGTAGFIADDLLLHTLWRDSPGSTVIVILSSALLAVSTLVTYSTVFLGKAVPVLAPDLTARERVVAVVLLALLVVLGVAPGWLLAPADAFLSVVTVPALSGGGGLR
ncbi:MAG: proton-conducting transporter membrane subunit [Acidobacteriota bacterium]